MNISLRYNPRRVSTEVFLISHFSLILFSTEMHRSPFENLNVERNVWKFYAIYDIETKSEQKQKIFRAYAIIYQFWFCYIGFALHCSSVFFAGSVREAAETLSVCVSYGNALIKIMIAYPNRGKIKKLYDKINVKKYEATQQDDFQYENSFLFKYKRHLCKFFYFRHVDRTLFYLKMLRYFLVFVTISFAMLMTRPIVTGEKVLPFTTIVKFDHEKYKIFYWAMFANQLLDAFFAGGAEFAINLYLYFIIICIEFMINLLGQRLYRFGHDKFDELTKSRRDIDRRMIIDIIKYHIEIGE